MESILQIGEGNFLRAFAEDYLQTACDNGYDGEAVVCQPRSNTKIINALDAQNCRYNILFKGRLNGEVINSSKEIHCISRVIDTVGAYEELQKLAASDDLQLVISNTTEAGICFNENDKMENSPAVSFPGKVTALLYERFKAGKAGLVFLPVELIENNGDALKQCVNKYIELWGLDDAFKSYVNQECSFCNTLVDRIVTGKTEFEKDNCAVACEPYASWIIEADERAKAIIPFDNVIYSESLLPYRNRKVRILNGVHTMTVLAAYHMGYKIVRDMMADDVIKEYIWKGLIDEIMPAIPLPSEELTAFAKSVLERFDNPFIDHKLLDISLNSVSKFKARCLGSMLDYYKTNGSVPKILSFGFAALINFYAHPTDYKPNDLPDVIDFFAETHDDIVKVVLSNEAFWDCDLTELSGFYETVKRNYDNICNDGMKKAMEKVINE
ncbi:MAG: tagaturonate reductase [Clostridium sp.]|nr:tagaturonate reductase [Clostridium sp.]